MHIGPGTIVDDRLPYNDAIAASWKQQTLLNLVRLRHMDTPFFVDVPQITSGYTLQGGAAATGGIFPVVNPLTSFAQQLGLNLNLQGAWQDRPTISYQPQTGSQFIRSLTTPINPGTVLFMIQAGYPADIVLNLTVDTINGVDNRSVAGGQVRPAEPEFSKVVQAIRKGQISGAVGIRIVREKDKPDSAAFTIRDKNIDPALAKDLDLVRQALRLDPQASELRVVFGPISSNPREIAIQSRSVLRILSELAVFVDVPPEDLAAGKAPVLSASEEAQPPLRVYSSCCKPADPYVSVCYDGHWYWIEKNDLNSKRTMSYLLILLALADNGAKENLPVITIQAN